MRGRVVRGAPSPAPLDWSVHRQYERFRERSRTTGRVVVVAVAVAAFLLFRVLEPFVRLSDGHERELTAVAALEDSLALASERHAALEEDARALASARECLSAAPWRASAAELSGRVELLRRSYRRLVDARLEEFIEAFEEMPDGPVLIGRARAAEEPLAVDLAASGSPLAAALQWAPPPEPTSEDGEAPDPDHPDRVGRREEDARAALERFEAARRAAPSPGARPAPDASAGTRLDDRHPAGGAKEPSISVLEALAALHVDPTRITEIDSFRDRDQFLFRRLRARVAHEADETVRGVLATLRREVLEPLGGLDDTKRTERLTARLETWAEKHLGNREWHAELRADPTAALAVGKIVSEHVGPAGSSVAQRASEVEVRRRSAALHVAELDGELERTRGSAAALATGRERLLPAAVGEHVAAGELLQVYPALVIALALVAALVAATTRSRFLRLRARFEEAGADASDAATVWTLVRRGAGSTAATLLLYAAATAALWLAFERGLALTGEWAALDGARPWPLVLRLSEAAPWFGRAAFLALGGAAVLTLLFEEDRGQAPPARPLRRVAA